MTELKDAQANGWSSNDDDTLSNPNSDSKLDTRVGDTGQLYVKRVGEDDVWQKYDPDQH